MHKFSSIWSHLSHLVKYLPGKSGIFVDAARCLRGHTISGSLLATRLLVVSFTPPISSLVISYTTSHLNSFPTETTSDVTVKATFGGSYVVDATVIWGFSKLDAVSQRENDRYRESYRFSRVNVSNLGNIANRADETLNLSSNKLSIITMVSLLQFHEENHLLIEFLNIYDFNISTWICNRK